VSLTLTDATFVLERHTVDVDSDGNGAADLIGATLDVLAISILAPDTLTVEVAGVAELTLSGALALARVTAAGGTDARYTALKMGAVTGTGNLLLDIGLSGTVTLALNRLDYNDAAAGFGRLNWANAFRSG